MSINQTGRDTLFSQQDDPLDYGGLHKRQVLSLDLVQMNATGDWFVRTFTGEIQVKKGMAEIFCLDTTVNWVAVGNLHRLRIQNRLSDLDEQAREALELPSSRFVFPFDGQLACLTRLPDRVDQTTFTDHGDLIAHLAAPNGNVVFDSGSFRLSRSRRSLPDKI